MVDRVQHRVHFCVGMTNHLVVMVFYDQEQELLEKQQVKESCDITAFCDIGECDIGQIGTHWVHWDHVSTVCHKSDTHPYKSMPVRVSNNVISCFYGCH